MCDHKWKPLREKYTGIYNATCMKCNMKTVLHEIYSNRLVRLKTINGEFIELKNCLYKDCNICIINSMCDWS
jgi:hypothetical protein